MEDWLHFPHPVPAIRHRTTESNALAVRNWLWVVAALVFLMVVVGGATRLTESGLSIVQWKPVWRAAAAVAAGVAEAFEAYKRFAIWELFPDMDVAGFKYIYAWEWAHRLLGRLIGVVSPSPHMVLGDRPPAAFGEASSSAFSRSGRSRAASAGGWLRPASSAASRWRRSASRSCCSPR
jgi:hypothetical protein